MPSPGSSPSGPGDGSTSLDTWQQNDIGGRAAALALRNDRGKVTLGELIDRGIAAYFDEARVEEARALEAMAHGLRSCRTVRAHREATCGRWYARPMSCHVRLCPDCERARAARMVERADLISLDMLRPVFWVLTLPNVPAGHLADGLDVVSEAIAALRRRAIVAGGHCHGHGCAHPPHRSALLGACRCARCSGCRACHHEPVRGGVWSVEAPWQPGRGDWNLHVNVLMDAPYILQAEMREAWRAVTCDAIRRAERRRAGLSGRLPRCRHEHDADGRSTNGCRGASWVWVETVKGEPGSDERRKTLREVFKYVTKGFLADDGRPTGDATPAAVCEALLALRSRRLVNGWGSMRGVRDDAGDVDAPDVLRATEVGDDLAGLPRTCPFCGAPAAWESGVEVPRVSCSRDPARGVLTWQPPRRHVH